MLASIQDLLNEGLLDSSPTFDFTNFLYSMIAVFVLSLVILGVYKKSYQTTVYNRSFAISLPVTAMITAMIIATVSSNIMLSLGMVGALSIVRFRTAIKNPYDTVFMFWSVGLGITGGANLILIAIVSTLLITTMIFMLIQLEFFIDSYFLIIRVDSLENEEEILSKVKDIYKSYTLRNKTVKNGKLDLTLEVRNKQDKSVMVNEIAAIKHVNSVMLLSHNGDYISE